jgi:hypothetical protein
MTTITVNELLAMQKALKTRLNQLIELKNSTVSRTRYISHEAGTERIDEPTYSIKNVDKKVVDINNALFRIDKIIKTSNAKTEVQIDIDYDKLSTEIE